MIGEGYAIAHDPGTSQVFYHVAGRDKDSVGVCLMNLSRKRNANDVKSQLINGVPGDNDVRTILLLLRPRNIKILSEYPVYLSVLNHRALLLPYPS